MDPFETEITVGEVAAGLRSGVAEGGTLVRVLVPRTQTPHHPHPAETLNSPCFFYCLLFLS